MRFVALLARVVPHSWIVTPVTADAKEATQKPTISVSRAAHAELGRDEPRGGVMTAELREHLEDPVRLREVLAQVAERLGIAWEAERG